MNIFIIGLALDTIGKILIGVAVLTVHRHIFRERNIDTDVLKTIKREWILTLIGILLIVLGSILQLIFHLE